MIDKTVKPSDASDDLRTRVGVTIRTGDLSKLCDLAGELIDIIDSAPAWTPGPPTEPGEHYIIFNNGASIHKDIRDIANFVKLHPDVEWHFRIPPSPKPAIEHKKDCIYKPSAFRVVETVHFIDEVFCHYCPGCGILLSEQGE